MKEADAGIRISTASMALKTEAGAGDTIEFLYVWKMLCGRNKLKCIVIPLTHEHILGEPEVGIDIVIIPLSLGHDITQPRIHCACADCISNF